MKRHQPRPITPTYCLDYVSNAIDTLSTSSNIIFYTKKQLSVLSKNYKKLVILAGFGTGKTFLLREKAIVLSKDSKYKGGVYYVVCSGEGLLYHQMKQELEPYGVIVLASCVSSLLSCI